LTTVSPSAGSGLESDTYGYDLQHRLNYANITRTEQGQSVGIVVNSYTYDDSGYRASGNITVTVGGTPTTTNTKYLTDLMNPTGFSQVLEENTGGTGPSMSYIIGLSLLAQTNASGATSYLLPDAQGSTRQLTDSSGNITARFAFDAWGVYLYAPIGVLNQPGTKILYTGQQFDPVLLQYYLRARFYSAASGRFNRIDPYAGNTRMPLTLHRYGYTEGNPVNRSDPSGQCDICSAIGQAIVSGIQNLGRALHNAAVFAVRLYIRAMIALNSLFSAIAAGWNRVSGWLGYYTARAQQIAGSWWNAILRWFSGNSTPGREVPGGGLDAHEAAGGHTLLEHVAQTYERLLARFTDPTFTGKAASSFPSKEVAEDAISEALAARGPQIQAWLSGGKQDLVFEHQFSYNIGAGLPRGQEQLVTFSNMFVKLVRDKSMVWGYRIQTAYPKE
jgi:RHS repeat-associated protein